MNMIYKFFLFYNGNIYEVHPIYKDDLAINYELEPNQKFFREKLSGNLVFVGSEADNIINAPFTTEFILEMYYSTDGGFYWPLLHKCRFYHTDCQIDADNKRVTVKPDVKDRYNKILDGLEKEFNLIDLLPVTEKVRMAKRALLQLYDSGDNKVTNVFGGFSWEEDFDIGSHTPEDLHFASNMSICCIKFVRVFGSGGLTGLQKTFIAQPDSNGEFEVTNGDGLYKLKRVKWGESSYDLQLRLLGVDVQVAHYWNDTVLLPDSLNFIDDSDMAWGVAECDYYGIYARWLLDKQSFTVDGTTYTATALASDDPSYGGNLHYVLAWSSLTVVPSKNFSLTPTKWGKFDDTHYYDQPTGTTEYFIPIARSFWGVASIWYQQGSEVYDYEPAMQKEYYLRDAYPLWSVISVLLNAIGSSVTFAGTSVYSEFFYAATNPVAASWVGQPYITPKSNILVGEYTQPAMKAPITLQDVFNMLAKAFKCYWFIDGNNRLRIEHISWFKNGGSYGGTHQIGIDLTALTNTRNGKKWSFDTAAWQYDKVDMPAQYQYKWMDAGTDIFDGWPFEIVSQFVQTDKVEEITISNFTSDVDYMQIAPENCSKDGFALMVCADDNGTKYLEQHYFHLTVNGTQQCKYVSQNWYASLHALMYWFLNYDLPSKAYQWGSYGLMASPDIQRGKRQQVNIPYGLAAPEAMKLVRTTIGDGQVQTLSLKLSSRMAKATLLYDTY